MPSPFLAVAKFLSASLCAFQEAVTQNMLKTILTPLLPFLLLFGVESMEGNRAFLPKCTKPFQMRSKPANSVGLIPANRPRRRPTTSMPFWQGTPVLPCGELTAILSSRPSAIHGQCRARDPLCLRRGQE